jgi:hypothetical protein
VRSKSGEIAAFGGRGLLERLPNARVPHRLALVLVLREDPGLLVLQLGDPLPVSVNQVAQRQRALALLRLGRIAISPRQWRCSIPMQPLSGSTCLTLRPVTSEIRVPVAMQVSSIM